MEDEYNEGEGDGAEGGTRRRVRKKVTSIRVRTMREHLKEEV